MKTWHSSVELKHRIKDQSANNKLDSISCTMKSMLYETRFVFFSKLGALCK